MYLAYTRPFRSNTLKIGGFEVPRRACVYHDNHVGVLRQNDSRQSTLLNSFWDNSVSINCLPKSPDAIANRSTIFS